MIVLAIMRASQTIRPIIATIISAKIIPALKLSSIRPQPESETDKIKRQIIGVYFLISDLLLETRKPKQWFAILFLSLNRDHCKPMD
jgi:hypothetical protein